MEYLSCAKAAEKWGFLSVESSKCARTGDLPFAAKKLQSKGR